MHTLVNHLKIMHADFVDAVVDFSWQSKQTRMALKTAIACVLAVGITNAINIPHAYWAGISTVIMMQPDNAAIIRKAWMRAGGACVGSFLSLFFVALTIQHHLLFALGTFLIITWAFYKGATSKYGYFWSYMLGHIVIVAMISVMDPYNSNPVHIAFFRSMAVSIGVAVALVIHIIIWPETESEQNPVHSQEEKPDSPSFKLSFFSYKLTIDKPLLAYSIKGGLGIVSAFWIWQWLRIPGGGLNMSVAVITVLQQKMINTYQKGLLRILGCIAGAAAGIFILSFNIDSPFIMALIILTVIFPFAYLWGSKPGVAYLGAQGAIAFLLAVVHDTGAANSLAPAIERSVGITLGIASICLISLLWPTTTKE
jgi:uncharacterized membrane protein YccC